MSNNQKQLKTGGMATLPPITAAAVTTAAVMYPVDIVRALTMAQSSSKGPKLGVGQLITNFYNQHGAKGFVTQGVGAEMARATFSRVIKFWLQPIIHLSLFNKEQTKGSPFTKGIAGALATIPEILTISPFENAKLAKQLDAEGRFAKGGTADVMKHLVNTRGFGGLYIGYVGMQLRQALWTAGFFMSLDVFKSQTDKALGKGSVSNVVAGFFSGVFGTMLNCWCDVVRTGIQKQAIADTFNPEIARPRVNAQYFIAGVTDFTSATANIAANKGIQGLYAGFGVKSLYLGGSGALLATLIPIFKGIFGVA